jgi:DNA-binding NtrC family response regulator
VKAPHRDNPTERLSPERAAEVRTHAEGPGLVSLLLHYRDGATMAPLQVGRPVVVGRSAEADVDVDDPSLSRAHARFTLREDGSVVVEDLGSTNGTWVSGRRVSETEMGDRVEVTLGSVIAAVHVLSPGSQGPEVLQRHDDFRRWLDAELARARFFKRPLTYALIRPASGSATPLRRWSPALQARLRPIDQLALYATDTVELLLPEVSTEEAERLLPRVIADGSGEPLYCGASVFPQSARSAEEMIEVARRALNETTAKRPVSIADPDKGSAIGSAQPLATISASPAMQRMLEIAARVARGNIPVLLVGETGVGKEVVARLIHQSSPRKAGPLISVNCAALPEQLLESALFGHERGAFTGAAQQQAGVFEAASGGIVFLDEIGELPAPAQAALLRVLETKKVARVGSTKEIALDVRVLAATHRDLEAMVREGRFREDLLYRLNAMTIDIPPLRERREDVQALAREFLREANLANATHVEHIEPDAMALLERHAWPGNVRELRNVIARGVVISDGRTLRVEDLPMGLVAAGCPPSEEGASSGRSDVGEDFWTRVERFEAELLTEALRASNGNQRAAAQRLGLPLRTLVHKIRVYNLKRA